MGKTGGKDVWWLNIVIVLLGLGRGSIDIRKVA